MYNKDNILDRFIDMKRKNRIPNSVLIECNNGIKGYDCANKIAKVILCEADLREKKIPCNKCNSCVKINAKTHPDIKVIGDANRSILIDEIRNMILDSYVVPNETNRKIYIINGAHMMTAQAQNAMLKIIEEPVEHSVFILSCISERLLLSTVRSRVQVFKLYTQKKNDKGQLKVEKSREIACEIFENLLNEDFVSILNQFAKFNKDRNLFDKVISDFDDIIAENLRNGFINSNLDMSIEKLIKVRELISDAKEKVRSNANAKLLSTWFFMHLREIGVFKL